MNYIKIIFAFFALLMLSACQHDIDPDNLHFPPDPDEPSEESTAITKQETQKTLADLSKQSYPPYTIQGGDVFRIDVYNEEDLSISSSSTTVVTPDGYLVVKLAGPVNVANLTIVEATKKMEEALTKYVKHPQVGLIPEKTMGVTASLYGEVLKPGNYAVSDKTKLSDFVANGQGFTTGLIDNTTVDSADIANGYIVRQGKMLPVDFNKALLMGDPLNNILVHPGDIVYIPKREGSRVMVIGEVITPRVVNWNPDLTVLEAIANASGLSSDYWSTGLVMRKAKPGDTDVVKVYKFNIDKLMRGEERNFRLVAGDIVYVPRDSVAEYNVFVKKILPTAQIINLLTSPMSYWYGPIR